ncbi:chloride channel protein [Streptococcus pyogenes]|nr:chloride channel protein [Streptococcus pyogenes]SUO66058.1 chloride channel protein [Streptococcus pyogenes]
MTIIIMDSNSAHETDNLSVSFLNFCYNSLMKRHFLLLTFYLFLTGLTAGLVAFILTKAIHLIQSLSFGFSQGSFSTMIASVPPQRRALSLLFAGLLAGLGWHLLAKKGKDIQSIQQIIQDDISFSPWTQFWHGWLQLTTVSMGAPVGREGASREVAVALTSLWSQRYNLSKADQKLLLACASGAALGAVYNAPLATILFILEAILNRWSLKNIYAAYLTSYVAVETVALLQGRHEIQYLMPQQHWTLGTLIWSVLAGLILSLFAHAYKHLLEHLPKADAKSQWFIPKVLIAFSLIAGLSIFFPEILGNGKAGLLFFLHEEPHLSYISWLLVAKAVAISLVFASGAKGGKIAPSMMLGGASGLLLAILSQYLIPLSLSNTLAIMVGATIFLGVINKIPLAAPVFLVEITGQSLLMIIPLALANLIFYFSYQFYRFILK